MFVQVCLSAIHISELYFHKSKERIQISVFLQYKKLLRAPEHRALG